MNWLAHLFLSKSNGEHRLGNLLGDLAKGKERKRLNPCFDEGMKCHLLIDSFTDRHLVFRNSKRRIKKEHRRYSGVLIDIFYDHFLAINWHQYSQVSLAEFTRDVYDSFNLYWDVLPIFPKMVIHKMIEQDWLGSYYYISGIEKTLERIQAKLSNKHRDSFNVNAFLHELDDNYAELEKDFQQFFPEIIQYLNELSKNQSQNILKN